jgi:hypothetical protein
VDTWYTAPGNPLIHLWLTDNRDLGDKDPVEVGDPLTMADGSTWSLLGGIQGLDADRTNQLSTRLADGVTVTMDSGIPLDDHQNRPEPAFQRA